VLNNPVRRGSEIAETLQSSRVASAVIDTACARALEQHGLQASFSDLANTAFDEMVYDLAIIWDRRTRVPAGAAAAIRAHLEARGWRASG
jgi:hypothetical protein